MVFFKFFNPDKKFRRANLYSPKNVFHQCCFFFLSLLAICLGMGRTVHRGPFYWKTHSTRIYEYLLCFFPNRVRPFYWKTYQIVNFKVLVQTIWLTIRYFTKTGKVLLKFSRMSFPVIRSIA